MMIVIAFASEMAAIFAGQQWLHRHSSRVRMRLVTGPAVSAPFDDGSATARPRPAKAAFS
jgi:hypothetical protein